MRKVVVIVLVGAALSIGLAAVVAGGHAAPKPGLAAAVERTQGASSTHFVIHVALERRSMRLTLQIHGQASARTISVRMKMGDVTLADGTVVPGSDGAAIL